MKGPGVLSICTTHGATWCYRQCFVCRRVMCGLTEDIALVSQVRGNFWICDNREDPDHMMGVEGLRASEMLAPPSSWIDSEEGSDA